MTAIAKLLINQKDLDCAVDCFEKVVKNVVKNGNEVQQANLLTKLKYLTPNAITRYFKYIIQRSTANDL